MVKRARRLSLFLPRASRGTVPETFVETLAAHLVGQSPGNGERLALPGWPTVTIESIEPPGARISPGTEIVVHIPPNEGEGALSVVFLVDASLTMSKGEQPTAYERAARTIEEILLNGRGFIARAGIVVQGGTTRQVDELTHPDDVSGASILKVPPRGTFDLSAGLQRSVDMLISAPVGPNAIIVLTDGDDGPSDPLRLARPALHAGVHVIALAPGPPSGLSELCEHTGGLAGQMPEQVFDALADLAGAEASLSPGPAVEAEGDQVEGHEFEVVIETMEDPA